MNGMRLMDDWAKDLATAELVIRTHYMPLYPIDKPISEMTPYEQGLLKRSGLSQTIANAICEARHGKGTKSFLTNFQQN